MLSPLRARTGEQQDDRLRCRGQPRMPQRAKRREGRGESGGVNHKVEPWTVWHCRPGLAVARTGMVTVTVTVTVTVAVARAVVLLSTRRRRQHTQLPVDPARRGYCSCVRRRERKESRLCGFRSSPGRPSDPSSMAKIRPEGSRPSGLSGHGSGPATACPEPNPPPRTAPVAVLTAASSASARPASFGTGHRLIRWRSRLWPASSQHRASIEPAYSPSLPPFLLQH